MFSAWIATPNRAAPSYTSIETLTIRLSLLYRRATSLTHKHSTVAGVPSSWEQCPDLTGKSGSCPYQDCLGTLTTWLGAIEPGTGRTLYLVKSRSFYGYANMRLVHRRLS